MKNTLTCLCYCPINWSSLASTKCGPIQGLMWDSCCLRPHRNSLSAANQNSEGNCRLVTWSCKHLDHIWSGTQQIHQMVRLASRSHLCAVWQASTCRTSPQVVMASMSVPTTWPSGPPSCLVGSQPSRSRRRHESQSQWAFQTLSSIWLHSKRNTTSAWMPMDLHGRCAMSYSASLCSMAVLLLQGKCRSCGRRTVPSCWHCLPSCFWFLPLPGWGGPLGP